jgi:hypothetical protein
MRPWDFTGREEDFKILLKLGEALEPAEAFSFWGETEENLSLGAMTFLLSHLSRHHKPHEALMALMDLLIDQEPDRRVFKHLYFTTELAKAPYGHQRVKMILETVAPPLQTLLVGVYFLLRADSREVQNPPALEEYPLEARSFTGHLTGLLKTSP